MSNKIVFHKQDIIRLLERWGTYIYPYPQALQSKRRSEFLAAGAAFLLHGAGKAMGKSRSRAGHADAPMTSGMKIIIGVLYTAILTSSLYLGLTYYEDIATWIDRLRSTPTPTLLVPLPAQYSTNIPTITTTPTTPPTSTPMPTASDLSEPPNSINTPVPNTPVPNTPTNPGHHYGQTKTPKPGK
jgi:hypothetical protein